MYEVAQNELRPLSDQYSEYSAKVDQTTAFNLNPPPAVGIVSRGSGFFRSGSALLALRDEVQYAFAQSSVNIEAAAATLIEVADSYSGADDETQSDFDALVAEGFPEDEESEPPPRAPVYPDGTRSHDRPVPKD